MLSDVSECTWRGLKEDEDNRAVADLVGFNVSFSRERAHYVHPFFFRNPSVSEWAVADKHKPYE
jgi:hypothetical protein